MNTNARTAVIVKGWASAFALAIGLWNSSPAVADPIRFSTSGHFDMPAGTGELAGVTDAAPGDSVLIGTVPVDGINGVLGATAFHIQFKFNTDLPPIDVSGTATYFGYNPDLPVLDSVVSTSATSAQVGLYPELFQKLIAHPDWLHTTSFRSDNLPTMAVALSVHPEDPGAIRPVPEPSSLVIVAMACAGLGWRTRRRLRRAVSR
jgi:hypothetical protein